VNGFVCLDVVEAVCAAGGPDGIDRADCGARFCARVLVDAVEGLPVKLVRAHEA
jgi:hypothetical protein